jgi:hypothetical protein
MKVSNKAAIRYLEFIGPLFSGSDWLSRSKETRQAASLLVRIAFELAEQALRILMVDLLEHRVGQL